MSREGSEPRPGAIGVVGVGCWLPGSKGPRDYWVTILARRLAFRQLPDVRTPVADYVREDKRAPDMFYQPHAAVIDGFEFDWARYRIPKATFACTDVAHWLALEVANVALRDAGFTRESVPRDRSGVFVGNTLTGEQMRLNAMRLRWPYVRRTVVREAVAQGLDEAQIARLVAGVESRFKAGFPEVTEDFGAGNIAATIAGRICNYFDFHGAGYTVDAACASSLVAVSNACDSLAHGDLDLAVAGGVDISLDPFELVGFAKAGALARDAIMPFDSRGAGFVPGEGAAFIVLQRLEDARRDGREVLAVIEGWGLSTDGRSGIMQPQEAGQAAAIRRAYAKASYPASALDFVECHGTGTRAGDRTELTGLGTVLEEAGAAPRSIGVTSAKSVIGHTKATAGIAAAVKAILAVNQRVIPPTASCEQPNAVFDGPARAMVPLVGGRVAEEDATLRAGVSAFGFGGLNAHVTISSADPPSARFRPELPAKTLLVSGQDVEVLPIVAASRAALTRKLDELEREARGMSRADLTDLAADLGARTNEHAALRAAIVAGSPAELVKAIEELRTQLAANEGQSQWSSPTLTAFLGSAGAPRATTAWVFPGQGSQQVASARWLAARFPWADELLDRADAWSRAAGGPSIRDVLTAAPEDLLFDGKQQEADERLRRTELAQPAICATSMLFAKLLGELGLRPDVVSGHSLGELGALWLAGAIDDEHLVTTAALRGLAMGASSGVPSGMTSLDATVDIVQPLLRSGEQVYLANVNTPRHVVVSGTIDALEALEDRARRAGITARRLRVSGAFHSPLMTDGARTLARSLALPKIGALSVPIIAGATGKPIPVGTDVGEHVVAQIEAPVRWDLVAEEIRSRATLVIEVAPGRVLSGLLRACYGDAETPTCVSIGDKASSHAGLGRALALAWTHGHDVRWKCLSDRRAVSPYVPPSARVFVDVSIERTRDASLDAVEEELLRRGSTRPRPASIRPAASEEVGALGTTELLRRQVAKATGYPLDSVDSRARLLDDLNLDSIKSAEVVSTIARKRAALSKIDPSSFANASIEDIARAIDAVAAPSLAPQAAEDPSSTAAVVAAELERLTGFNPSLLGADVRLADLGLGREAQHALVAALGEELGLREGIDGERLAELTVGHLVRIYDGLVKTSRSDAMVRVALGGTNVPTWTRRYRLVANERARRPGHGRRAEDRWEGARVLVATSTHEAELVEAVVARLSAEGAAVEILGHAAARALGPDAATGFTHVVVVLDRPRMDAAIDRAALGQTMTQLLAATVAPLARESLRRRVNVAFVQRGAGRLDLEGVSGSTLQSPALGFAGSLSLERNDCRVRVVDLDAGLDPNHAAAALLAELTSGPRFAAVGIDGAGVRRELALEVDEDDARSDERAVVWSSDDVVLFVGGGKGITAECALAFARDTGVALALVGRTKGADEELARTLSRFQTEGVRHRYYPCDVTSPEECAALVSRVTAEQGPITGLVFGAGVLRARRSEHVTVSDATDELAPKVLGFDAIVTALRDAPLKACVAFTSTIGVMGFPGSSVYAVSNTLTDALVRKLRIERPRCHSVSLAWGLWGEVGIGAKHGTGSALRSLGLAYGEIGVGAGARIFVDEMKRASSDAVRVISGRVVGFATWEALVGATEQPRIRHRFVERVIHEEPRVELIARARLSIEEDLYLQDHVYRGMAVLPTVAAAEAIAQAARALHGAGDEVVRLLDFAMPLPLVVDPERGEEIELRAIREAPSTYRVELTGEKTAFQTVYASASVVFGARAAMAVAVPERTPLVGYPTPEDLYAEVFFVGPRFQRLRAIHAAGSTSVSTIEARKVPSVFASSHPPLELGDPYARDALIHTAFLHDLRALGFTVRIGRIEFGRALDAVGDSADGVAQLGVATIARRNDRDIEVVLERLDAEGGVVERFSDYSLRLLEANAPVALAERVSRAVERHLRLTATVRCAFEPGLRGQRASARHEREQALVAEAVPTATLSWAEDGRPLLDGGQRAISFSHLSPLVLFMVADEPIGCDVVATGGRGIAEWVALVSEKHEPLVHALASKGDPQAVAGARVWAAIEAVRKASGAADIALKEERRAEDGVVVLRAVSGGKSWSVATLPVEPPSGKPAVCAVAAASHELERVALVDKVHVGWRDCVDPVGIVAANRLVDWLQRQRERMLDAEAGRSFVAGMLEGKDGGVIRSTEIRCESGLCAYEDAGVSLWLADVADTSLAWQGEVVARGTDGASRRVAWLRTEGAYVSRRPDGSAVPCPIPETHRAAYMRHLDPTAAPAPPDDPLVQAARLPPPLLERDRPSLSTRTYRPSLLDSDLVGNVNNVTFFDWIEDLKLEWLRARAPALLARGTAGPRPFTRLARVVYLRESMPFDEVTASLSLLEAGPRALLLGIDFRSDTATGARRLAWGTLVLEWGTVDAGVFTSALIPETTVERLRVSSSSGGRVDARPAHHSQDPKDPQEERGLP